MKEKEELEEDDEMEEAKKDVVKYWKEAKCLKDNMVCEGRRLPLKNNLI